MVLRKGFRFRIYPSREQIQKLLAWESASRFLWNLALEQRLAGLRRPKCDRRYLTAFDQINELKALRAEVSWLADAPRDVQAQLLVELDKAWQRCFKKLARAPRWKRKGRDVIGLCEPHPKAWNLVDDRLHFPKLGKMRAVVHRALEGTPKTCTIRRDGDQWFASILCEIEVADPATRTAPVVAIDRGVVLLTADSDGRAIENPAYLERTLKRLARAQRTVARRKKGSKNREKAKACVASLHRKVRRQREHVLHQISHDYAKSHGTVVIEKLQIGNMVKANSGLARRVLDASWGRLAEMLRYKLAWSGGVLGEVPAAYSSQTCNGCGHVDAASRIAQASFVCTKCGMKEHADINAAKVLKSRWRPSAQPVEGSSTDARRSRKALRVPRRSTQSSSL